jgi:hypothetical protein
MGNLMKGIKIAAYVAEIIVASSVIIELVEKYGGRKKKKNGTATSVSAAGHVVAEDNG